MCWKKAIVMFIPKGQKEREHRPISLTMSTVYRTSGGILLNWLLDKLGGFHKNLIDFMKKRRHTNCHSKLPSNMLQNFFFSLFYQFKGASNKASSLVILEEFTNKGVGDCFLKWIRGSLRGRRARVFFPRSELKRI